MSAVNKKDISAYYIGCIFVFVPLLYHDKYFDMGAYKYSLFLKISLAYLILMIPALVIKRRKSAARIHPVDIFIAAYALACLMSFIISPYNTFAHSGLKDNPAWTGYPGWLMGLRSQLIFVLIYFLISRFMDPGNIKPLLWLLIASSFIVFLLAVLHRFLIDPLGLYDELDEGYRIYFLTTMGQASWYSSFLCTVLPAGLVMYILGRNRAERLLLSIYIFTGFSSLVTQNSDSAYVALAAMLAVLFVFAFDSWDNAAAFFNILILFLISAVSMGFLRDIFSKRALPLDRISEYVTGSSVTRFLLISAVLVYILIFKTGLVKKVEVSSLSALRTAFLLAAALCLLLFPLCVMLCTKGYLTSLSSIPYFVFNEEWGNNRGFNWSFTAEMIKSYSPLRRLFGIGSDCYADYAYEFFADTASDKWGELTLANAHNEWLNMLATVGLAGLISYAGIFFTAFISFFKKRKTQPYLMTGCACIASYFFHNMFCYQTVASTPFIFILTAMCSVLITRPSHSQEPSPEPSAEGSAA